QSVDGGLIVERSDENGLQTRRRPKANFARRRFEDCIVALIRQDNRNGARVETGLFDKIGVEPV
ncbi:MAG: hypothetical protein ACO3PC_04885, partial [Steroidobacteraceae bacterium]